MRAQTEALLKPNRLYAMNISALGELPRPHNFRYPAPEDFLRDVIDEGKHYHVAHYKHPKTSKAQQLTCKACPEDIYVEGHARAVTTKSKATRQCTCSPVIWRCELCFLWHVLRRDAQERILKGEHAYLKELTSKVTTDAATENATEDDEQ